MSRIVKSMAVVDRRPLRSTGEEQPVILSPIIKPGALGCNTATARPAPATVDSLRRELNEARVEVEQEKARLRALRREIGEAEERMARLAPAGEGGESSEGDPTGEQEAARIVNQARRRAEELLAQTEEECEILRREAREQGYREGSAQGLETAQEEFQRENAPKAERLEGMIRTLREYEARRLEDNEAELVKLAVAVAEKIIGRELATEPAWIADLLRRAVEKNRREEKIHITLGPGLLPVEESAAREVVELLEGMGANITVDADPDAAEGACLVETSMGCTDASVETQLENVKQALLAN